jgi:hypothetical protein
MEREKRCSAGVHLAAVAHFVGRKSYVSSIAPTIKTLQVARRVCRPSQLISTPKASRWCAGRAFDRQQMLSTSCSAAERVCKKKSVRARRTRKNEPPFLPDQLPD